MECEKIRELLALHMTGDLEAEDCSRVEAHLAECAECAAEFRAFLDIKEMLLRETFPDPGEAFWKRFERTVMEKTVMTGGEESKPTFMERLSRLIETSRRIAAAPAFAYAASVAIVIVMGSLFVWRAHVNYESARQYAFTEVDVTMEIFPVLLYDMSEEEITDLSSVVSGWGVELPFPVQDLVQPAPTEIEYMLYNEIESMGPDQLSMLLKELENWRES